MSALLPLLLRHWPAVIGGLVVAFLATLLAIRTGQRDDARLALERAEARHLLFAERVRARAEEISRRALERARRIEAEQDRISEEIAHDYQDRLARLRADYDRRLSESAGRADPGRPGRASGLPALPHSPGRAHGPAEPDRLPLAHPELALGERLLCSEQSVRLLYLQQWLRQQQGVDRRPEP